MNSLHSEVVRHSGSNLEAPMMAPPPPGVNVGDPFESDEDEEDETAQNAGGGAAQGGLQITPQQLAAALAMATGRGPAHQQPTPPTLRQPAASGPPAGASSSTPATAPVAPPASASAPLITSDMFQLAMQQALAAATQQPRQMQNELQQLRDMGFINEQENARALRITNGDVMAAIEFIISERERQEQGMGLD